MTFTEKAEFTNCAVENCLGNSHQSAKGRRGLCCSHYYRLRQYGDPLSGRTKVGDPLRFVHEVAVPYDQEECLTWPYGRNSSGYGKISVNSKEWFAHRYICTIVHGEPPSQEHVAAHSCGKGHLGCVNPKHLSWKTKAENTADQLSHGTHIRGERNVGAKLTEKQVREIIALRGTKLQREIAAEYGVSQMTVSQIQRGLKWAWIIQK